MRNVAIPALAASILALALPAGAQAQDFWTNTLPTITGTDTLSTTLRQQEKRSTAPDTGAVSTGGCSIDALSPTEKSALYARYVEVKRTQGAAKADAWVQAQGRALYNRMAAQGRC